MERPSTKIYVMNEDHFAQLEIVLSDLQNVLLDLFSNHVLKFDKSNVQTVVKAASDGRLKLPD